jgi:hypothetical protein
MRPIPIPVGVPEQLGGIRAVLGVEESLRGDPLDACEYVVRPSQLYPGRPCLSALVELDDQDRDRIARGGLIWLTLDGGEWPWRLDVTDPDAEPADG